MELRRRTPAAPFPPAPGTAHRLATSLAEELSWMSSLRGSRDSGDRWLVALRLGQTLKPLLEHSLHPQLSPVAPVEWPVPRYRCSGRRCLNRCHQSQRMSSSSRRCVVAWSDVFWAWGDPYGSALMIPIC